jgi:hypothetical protein
MGSSQYPPIPPPGGGTPSLPPEGQPNPLQPGEYGPTSIPFVSTFNFKNIPPPSGLYVTRNDSIQVSVNNSASNVTVDVHARLLLASPVSVLPGQPDSPPDPTKSSVPSNTIASITQNFTPGNNRATNVFFMPLTEGWLLNLTVGLTGFSRKGQTYVYVFLQRGDAVGGPQSGTLLSGYTSNPATLIWPGSGTIYPTDGAGWLHSVQQGNPGAGAEFLITVPVNARWRLRALNAQLVIANSGIARTNMLQIKDASGNVLYVASAGQNSAINTTVQVSAAPGANITTQFSTIINVPLPGDVTLPQGFTIGSLTQQIGAGDQYQNIWAEVEEWIEL